MQKSPSAAGEMQAFARRQVGGRMEIIMGNGVQELLEMLYSLIKEAKSLPLSSDKCVLERDRALDIIDEMKAQFPTELAEARRLVDARAEFISNAKREADTIKKAAEERAKQLVNEQEIYKTAKARSTELLASTERNTSELKRAANEYVDDTLRRTEEAIAKALEETRASRASFRSAIGAMSNRVRAEEISEEEETEE